MRKSVRNVFATVAAACVILPFGVLLVRAAMGKDKLEDLQHRHVDKPKRENKSIKAAQHAVDATTTTDAIDDKVDLNEHTVFEGVGAPESPIHLIVRDSFVTAFNRQTRTACWSCERLTKSSVKPSAMTTDEVASREKSTFVEPHDEPDIFRPHNDDYMHSGFDRGHLVPSADFKWSQDAMNQTFVLSNIAPQVGIGFNRDYWARFEHMVRGLTRRYDDVYVCTGPAFVPSANAADGRYFVNYQMIGSPPNVAVPTHFYKVVVATRRDSRLLLDGQPRDRPFVVHGETDTDPVGFAVNSDASEAKKEPVTLVATATFLMPNAPISEATPVEEFIVDQSVVEKAVGARFFPKLREIGKDGLGRRVVDLCENGECMMPRPNFWEKKTDVLSPPPPPASSSGDETSVVQQQQPPPPRNNEP